MKAGGYETDERTSVLTGGKYNWGSLSKVVIQFLHKVRAPSIEKIGT